MIASTISAWQAYQTVTVCDPQPFVVLADRVGVNVGALQLHWTTLIGEERRPSTVALSRCIRRLSGMDHPLRLGPPSDRGPRFYVVARERLDEMVTSNPESNRIATLERRVRQLEEAVLVAEPTNGDALAASLGLRPPCSGCRRRLLNEPGPLCWRCQADERRTP